jgi:hypothetical protein
MGKPTNGIEWVDVVTLMHGLEGIHEVRVELTVSTVGGQVSGTLAFTVLAWVPTVEAHHTQQVGVVTRQWPDRVHPSFVGAVFNALYDLDREIGKAYKAGSF